MLISWFAMLDYELWMVAYNFTCTRTWELDKVYRFPKKQIVVGYVKADVEVLNKIT